MTRRVVVVGQGYVGLTLALRAVEVGFDVRGIDLSGERIDALRSGRSYVDDIPDDRVESANSTGRYRVSSDYTTTAGFNVAVITVPTPLREGTPDLSHIENAARALAPNLRPGATVILESTTYPGTTEELVAPILEDSGLRAGADFHLGYSPERVDPANRQWTLENTPKVVSGIDDDSRKSVKEFYDQLVERTVEVSAPKVAELTKLLENTFRHVNVALVNELAMFADDLGIDVWEAIDTASTKPFGYMRFTPGPGVGGHCLPIDPSYLSWQVRRTLGRPFRFVELANDVNDHMPDWVVHRITHLLNARERPVRGSRILLLGVAFKPNTSDARESPALRVADLLLELGADVSAVDTHVQVTQLDRSVPLVAPSPRVYAEADLVVLLTDHDDLDYDDVLAHAQQVFDTRHRLAGPRVVSL